MSRADELRAQYEAELAVAELEEELAAAKDTAEGPSRELKERLREARRVFREQRAGAPVADGDAVANPEPARATARTRKSGG